MSSWPQVDLDEISDISAGNPAPQATNHFCADGHPFVRMQDVGRKHIDPALVETTDRVSPLAVRECRLRLYPAGTLLIPKSGASVNLNHRAMLGQDAYVVSHLATIIPDQRKVLPSYLFHWSQRYDPRSQAQVTSLPSLPLSLIKTAKVPLPPLEEQQRIVGLLNQAAEIRLRAADARAKARAIIPALFHDMFGDPATNPKGWPMATVGNVLDSASYGTSKKASDTGGGLPVIRMGNVTMDGQLDTTDLKYIELTEADREKAELLAGDLLFNRTNSKELVGKTGLWDGRFEAVVASYFIRLRINCERLVPSYLWAFFNTSHMKRVLFQTARGAIGQANINAKELRAFPIAVPPLPLQTTFTEQVERLEAIACALDTAAARAEVMAASLSAQVFGASPAKGEKHG
ncbi:MAG: restriction endonuclease subunit S [Xanthobacteraceae bacterium]|nr:restriction endonuclease subunit S [Xanthobacteraceae bacterium]